MIKQSNPILCKSLAPFISSYFARKMDKGGLWKHSADIQGNTLYEAKREFTQF